MRVPGEDRVQELVDDFMVPLAFQAGSRDSHVERIVPERLVVRSHIDDARQDTHGMEACSGDVDVQLSDADPQSLHAQIAQSQHTAPIGDHHGIDLFRGPVVDHGRHVPAIFGAEEHAPRPAEVLGIGPACPSDRGGVHDRRHVDEVFHEHFVEERFVPILQLLQHLPLSYVFGGDVAPSLPFFQDFLFSDPGHFSFVVISHDSVFLQFEGDLTGGQEASQSQPFSFGCREGRSFVEPWIVQHFHPTATQDDGCTQSCIQLIIQAIFCFYLGSDPRHRGLVLVRGLRHHAPGRPCSSKRDRGAPYPPMGIPGASFDPCCEQHPPRRTRHGRHASRATLEGVDG
mmetsp:Transcript_10810/g.66772  ORF Transcript_10810/g.66772 Transcript_10810/m.66772 type:complete len:343 (-) Transcript_10810:4-1032(-)